MLSPFGWLYGKIADVRNTLYDKGVFKTHPLGARTISIGNITVGGTGKTPLVALVAEILAVKGEKVCILTRGYGREDPQNRVLVTDSKSVLANVLQGGDEPVELAQKLLGKAIIIADADRVSAAKWALSNFGVSIFVLDDGFQHRRAGRDLDIVCVDATDPFGNEKVLPAGILREPIQNLERADAIVITRADMAGNIDALQSRILELNPDSPIFFAENKISSVKALEDFHEWPQSEDKGVPALAFCALGNPRNFFEQLRRGNFQIAATKTFTDHHSYTQKDITDIETEAKASKASVLLTTAKDAVKLKNLRFEMDCFVVEIETVIDDLEAFSALFH